MTEEEVLEIIERVSSRFGRFKFGIYDEDDIKQESVILCIDALDRYKPGRPLENFLCVHVRNRLLTLMRDEGGTEGPKSTLSNPIPIYNIDEEKESSMMYEDLTLNNIIIEEMKEEINKRIPLDNRMDFIKMMNGQKVNKFKRTIIMELLEDLFE